MIMLLLGSALVSVLVQNYDDAISITLVSLPCSLSSSPKEDKPTPLLSSPDPTRWKLGC